MTAPVSVSGVLPLCRAVLADPTQLKAARLLAWRRCVSGVSGLTRARACAHTFLLGALPASHPLCFFTRKSNHDTPNTPNTQALKILIYKAFKCVGSVLGWVFLCWVGVLAQEARHD